MADEGMESVGGVSVTITGDYSQLEEALQAAIADARAGGASIVQAVSQGFDAIATQGAAAANSILALGNAATSVSPAFAAAAAQMSLFGDALQGVPWADANSQLNIFTDEIEPFSAGVSQAQDALLGFEAAFDPVEQAAMGAAEQLSLFGESFQAIPWQDATGQLALFSESLEPLNAGFLSTSANAGLLSAEFGNLGRNALAAAEQLDLFNESLMVPYAEASGQLNLFSEELEPIPVELAKIGAAATASGNQVKIAFKDASGQMNLFATEIENISGVQMPLFAHGVQEELDATGENIALAGENFGRFGEQAGTSVRSVISELRLLRGAFLIIMLPEMITNLVEGIVNFVEKQRDALQTSIVSWREYNEALEISNAAIKVSNAQLDEQIAKLEGRPSDGLRVALLEADEAAQKLALELDKDFDSTDEHLKKSSAGFGDFLVAMTEAARGMTMMGSRGWADFKEGAVEAFEVVTAGLGDLEDRLRHIQAFEGGDKSFKAQMKMIEDEIDAVSNKFVELSKLPVTPLIVRELDALQAELNRLQDQEDKLNDTAENNRKKAQLAELKEDKPDKFQPFQLGEITGGMNQYQEANAIFVTAAREQQSELINLVEWLTRYHEALNAGTTVLRKSGEDAADWAQRAKQATDALSGLPPELTAANGGLKEFDAQVKLSHANLETLPIVLRSLTPAAQEAARAAEPATMAWDAFKKAVRDLHLHDTVEQLQQMGIDVTVLQQRAIEATGAMAGLTAGTAAYDSALKALKGAQADVVEGERQAAEAAAKAAIETGTLGQSFAALAYQEIPRAFSTIEGQLTGMLFNWKNWGQQIANVFKSIGEMGVHILLQTLFAPLQQQMQAQLAAVFVKLGTASAPAAAGIGAVGGAAGAATPFVIALTAAVTGLIGALTALNAIPGGAAVATAADVIGQVPIPGLASGIDEVPHDMLAHLHKGEMVVKHEEAEDIRMQRGVERLGWPAHRSIHRALEGIEHVPRIMPVMLDEGERVLTKESNRVFTSLMQHHENVSTTHGDTYDFRGSSFQGIKKEELASQIMDTVVKRGRRSNVRW